MDDGNNATHLVYINCADTLQNSFASHLSREFRRKGIAASVNSKASLDVIERASAFVIVFSNNYLSSTPSLDKLVRVFLQRRRKNTQLVVPVFYGVSPSEVVVPEHDSADQIREWSSALQELRKFPGHQSREECSECEFVEEIVKDVYEKLFPKKQIGISSRLLEIQQLLCKQPWGIRRIGIWGMPGIGKTTLAKVVFDQISGGYEASCFIEHFHKAFHEKGLHHLLEEHFGKNLMELPTVPRDKVSKKRTLVVLDDVRNPLVAESFLGGFHWFGPGSLIILTSRDKQVFRLCQINHVYEVQSLNEDEALQLFSQCAFGEDIRQQNLPELSMEVIDYANGNPFALSFYGRELKGKKLSEMGKTFRELKQPTPDKIHNLFKSSYETLNDNHKNIFLDIACFFKGESVDYVMQLLEGCGFFPYVGINVLVDKCLVTISENRVQMQKIIQDFGREIINGETIHIERRRRLWEPCTIKYILEDDELEANRDPKATYTRALGTEDIEGIFLDTLNLFFDVKPGAFENMFNLRFLKIYCSSYGKHYGLCLPKGLESLPSKLRLLHWEKYPLQSLPQEFNPCHLVELNIPYSQLQKLWTETKNLKMLKIVRLCHSQQLIEIDDICRAQNIELIDLQGCTKLQSFPSTGHLLHLRVVNLSGCTEITSFPEVSSNIEELHLQGTGISELPISIMSLFKQVKLNRELSNFLTELSGISNSMSDERLTSLAKVVSSNQHHGKLAFLNMKDCYHLRSLPHMVDLESLRVLHLSGCSKLKDIQGFPRNLKELYLAGIAVEELPELPQSLEVLNAHGCLLLKSIPFGFEQLPKYYTFSDCFALSAQVVCEFVVNALANIERMARDYQHEQELKKSLAFSFTVPSPGDKKFTLDMQPGSSVMKRLDPSWRSTLVGFAVLVEVAFSEDFREASGFGISCICRWKDKNGVSQHMLGNTFPCWTPEEGVPKFQEEHLFVYVVPNLHPSSGEGQDPDIFADLVVFEFFPVNKQKKLLDGICTVKKCGVHVITDAEGDTSVNMTWMLSPLDCTKEVSDNDADEELIETYHDLDKKDKILLLYILFLSNDEETDVVAQYITSFGQEISSGFEVLASKSLIHISPYGVVVPSQLLQKLGKGVVRGPAGPSTLTLPDSSKDLERNLEEVVMTCSSSHNQKCPKEPQVFRAPTPLKIKAWDWEDIYSDNADDKKLDVLSVSPAVFRDLCSAPKLDKVHIGLDGPLLEIKKKLLNDSVDILVVSAPPGCGKTTLVIELCHDKKIKGKFKHIFFSVVSSAPNFRVLVQNLLQPNGDGALTFENDFQAEVSLRTLLQGLIQYGPILLVLDDVWQGTELLLQKFQIDLPGYKILVTSRFEFPSFGFTYHLKPLGDEDARTLLIHWASPPVHASPYEYEDLLQKIVKRCNGSPLVIEVIGGSLRGQALYKWNGQVESWSEGETFLGDRHHSVLQCLEDSLNNLKPHLKECFLDMGSFLEDQKIRASVIIDIWAELYGKGSGSSTTMYMKYLNDLASHNLLKLVPLGRNEHEDGFCNELLVTQHDILRELAIYQNELETIPERKRLILEIRGNYYPDWRLIRSQPINARLLSITTDDLFSSSWMEMDCPDVEALVLNLSSSNYALPSFIAGMKKLKVLTITSHGLKPAFLSNLWCLNSLPSLKRIRLERVSVALSDIPQLQLGSLKKLSFVMCSFGEVFYKEIDVSIALPSLQEIEMDYCYDLGKLPYWVCKVVSLKTLSITNCYKLAVLPKDIGKLSELEVLRLCSCLNLSELPEATEKLSNLRFLDVSYCLGLRKLPLQIGKLQKLKKIWMRKCSGCELPDSLKNLENLEVKCDEETGLLWKRLMPKMRNLRVLEEETEHNLNFKCFQL